MTSVKIAGCRQSMKSATYTVMCFLYSSDDSVLSRQRLGRLSGEAYKLK
jgi:hypothetical protein